MKVKVMLFTTSGKWYADGMVDIPEDMCHPTAGPMPWLYVDAMKDPGMPVAQMCTGFTTKGWLNQNGYIVVYGENCVPHLIQTRVP
jgi:hypothetical protein